MELKLKSSAMYSISKKEKGKGRWKLLGNGRLCSPKPAVCLLGGETIVKETVL